MAAFEVIALDTATPQLRAPGASDTYTFPRAVEMPLGTANGVLYLNGSKVMTSGSGLTFDGSTFAVNSAASIGSNTAKTKFYSDSTYNGIFNGASLTAAESVYMGAGGLFFFTSGSEQMRLTSTGLGIGTSSPAYKLDVRSATAGVSAQVKSTWSDAAQIIDRQDLSSSAVVIFRTAGVDGYSLGQFSGGASALEFRSGGLTRMLLDTSGNLGLGVTPSAWAGLPSNGVLQTYSFALLPSPGGGTNTTTLTTNAFYNGTNWIYRSSAQTVRYDQWGGEHRWFTAPSGTAGNAISFTQAMTLDTNGNLIIGTTSALGRFTVAQDQNALTTIHISNPNTGASAGTRVTIGSAGGPSDIQSRRTGGLTVITTNNIDRLTFDQFGNIVTGTAALATTATDGFIYVPSCAGPPTGVPTTYTGRTPMVVDTTNNRVYFNVGGTWRYAALI